MMQQPCNFKCIVSRICYTSGGWRLKLSHVNKTDEKITIEININNVFISCNKEVSVLAVQTYLQKNWIEPVC